ncbi:MAG TPA: SIMPL domain-containing protein [Polyangia bacterium]|nr:SIMPL domain-containing protein [Polyangia bacterium]
MIRFDGGQGRFLSSLVFALAFVVATMIVRNTVLVIKSDRREFTVDVTGSARRRVVSDRASWRAELEVTVKTASEGYARLGEAAQRASTWLRAKGFTDKELSLSAVRIEEAYEDRGHKERPHRIGYRLAQTLEVSSPNVGNVTQVARSNREFIEAAGMTDAAFLFRGSEVSIGITRMTDIKHEVLAEAVRNARERAEMIARHGRAKLGALRQAEFGDIEVRSPGSTEKYSDDSPSSEKEVIANVKVIYELE